MPKISEIKDSKYLTKDDCGTGILVTVGQCTQQDIAMQGQPEDLKWVLHFSEPEAKPMILKSVNAQLIAAALGSEDTDDWIGKKIVLFHDHTVQMMGKVVGGIRARAPKNQPKPSPVAGVPSPKPKPAPAPQPEPSAAPEEDDVPF